MQAQIWASKATEKRIAIVIVIMITSRKKQAHNRVDESNGTLPNRDASIVNQCYHGRNDRCRGRCAKDQAKCSVDAYRRISFRITFERRSPVLTDDVVCSERRPDGQPGGIMTLKDNLPICRNIWESTRLVTLRFVIADVHNDENSHH